MRIGKVLGVVTLNRVHASLVGSSLKLVTPMSAAQLQGEEADPAEEFVVFDELGAGQGALIAVSEGAEAAKPFRGSPKPVDAYNAAILDTVDIVP